MITVTFTRTDGESFQIEGNDIRVDSIGPSAEARGVIGVEFTGSDRVVHVPFVQSWEVDYSLDYLRASPWDDYCDDGEPPF